jgi:hypothetical protein
MRPAVLREEVVRGCHMREEAKERVRPLAFALT